MKIPMKVQDSVLYRSAQFISMLPLLRHRERERTSNQVEKFEGLSLNRAEGLENLNKVLRSEFNQEFLETRGMWSEHMVLFSSLSLNGVNFKKILEIGTHRGETTLVLHRLFPDAEITTWDLPTDVAKQIKIYTYSDSDQIIRERETNIGEIQNIQLIQRDSCNLVFEESSYDLIWLDGAHGYPVCTIDIANAVRMVSPGGLIVCDDVYKWLRKSDGMYRSTSAFETLEAFRRCGIIEYSLLSKRLAGRFNLWRSRTKYIAVAKVCDHSKSIAKS